MYNNKPNPQSESFSSMIRPYLYLFLAGAIIAVLGKNDPYTNRPIERPSQIEQVIERNQESAGPSISDRINSK